jgi:hypothetical protein
MSFLKLQFRPGINRDTTNYANEGGWYECDKIRFYSGFPQKIGGWEKPTPETFVGTSRQLWSWITSYQDDLLAVGTNVKAYIEVGGLFYDITPIRDTLESPDTDNCIETTDTSTTVNIAVTGHGCNTGDYVTISGVTGDVGGVPDAEINTEHVVTIVDNDNFTITVTTPATSTTSGGGTSIDIACQITPGFPKITAGYGWGAGAWNGDYGWGLASPTPVFLPQRDWWFDNFDNDLVMNIRSTTTAAGAALGGPIYYWQRGTSIDPSGALSTRATLLSETTIDGVAPSAVPTAASQVLISQNDKHLLAFGAQPYLGASTDFDPLLIRWASQDAPNQWAPSGTNSAGFLRVSRGSEIVRAIPTRQEIAVFTDTNLYILQFLGTTDVFGLQEIAGNISIMGPRSVITANNIVFWMGLDKFYLYDGRVQTLPCTLREHVFKNFNYNQRDQVICGTNEGFNEIWWFYCSENSDWVDSYVIYQYLDNIWYYGSMSRTAWLDIAQRQIPFAAYTNEAQDPGVLYAHESGIDADGAPMTSYIQSSDYDLGDGEQFMLSRRLIPDISFNTSTANLPEVDIEIRSRNFPGSSYNSDSNDNQRVIETSANVYTDQVFIRARGRQMALKIASDQLGVQWQLGMPRVDVRPDGKR